MRKSALGIYFSIRTWWPLWFYILNLSARQKLRQYPISLDSLQLRILEDLRRDGISVTSLEELFPDENRLSKMQEFVRGIENNATSRTKKAFLQQFWSIVPQLDFNNPFISLALDARIRNIANSYMEMWTRFKAFTLIRTIPVGDADPIQSQRWHRDPEEKRMCKVFLYLVDVDEETGPFTYIPQSVYGKKWGNLFPQKPPEGSYPESGDIEKIIPQEEYRVMTGKAGTILFCDTSGFHRGGHATSKERLMFTVHYAAPTFSEGCRYLVSNDQLERVRHDPALHYALVGEKLQFNETPSMK